MITKENTINYFIFKQPIMINIKFLPSKDNLPTHVYTEENEFAYKYTEDIESKENRIYYDAFLVDSEVEISSGDLCIVIHPYDSKIYMERCKIVSMNDGREVFYGEEGTRCLLSDVAKIIEGSEEFIKGENIHKLNTETIKKFLNKKPMRWF